MKYEPREYTLNEQTKILTNANLYNVAEFGIKDAERKEQQQARIEQRLEIHLNELSQFKQETPLKATIEAIKEIPTPPATHHVPERKHAIDQYSRTAKEQEPRQPEHPPASDPTLNETKPKDIVEFYKQAAKELKQQGRDQPTPNRNSGVER